MTLIEAKDQVAKKYRKTSESFYDNWKDMENNLIGLDYGIYFGIERMQEAAELYARSKWEDACDKQINSCVKSARTIGVSCGDPMTCGCQGTCEYPKLSINKNSIENAPKPEFKP